MDVMASPLPITPAMEAPVEYNSPLLGVYGCCWLSYKGTVNLSLGLPHGAAIPFIDGGRLDNWMLFPITAGVNNSHSSMVCVLCVHGQVDSTGQGEASVA